MVGQRSWACPDRGCGLRSNFYQMLRPCVSRLLKKSVLGCTMRSTIP
jgi:hypothetical protein